MKVREGGITATPSIDGKGAREKRSRNSAVLLMLILEVDGKKNRSAFRCYNAFAGLFLGVTIPRMTLEAHNVALSRTRSFCHSQASLRYSQAHQSKTNFLQLTFKTQDRSSLSNLLPRFQDSDLEA